MTSDGNAAEEPSPAVAAIVGAIRGRIVEYKELLLRQLTDQRVALLAIEDVAVEVPKRIQEADDAPVVAAAKTVAKEPEEPAERPREEVAEEEVQQKGETVVEVKLEEAPTEPTTEDVECDVAAVNGHAEDESADRKRRASEVVEDEATPKPAEDVVKPEAPPPAQQSVAPIVHVVKRMRNAGAAIEQEPRGLQMPQRSSTPPNRYLEHRDDDEDEELRRLDESMPLVLKSPRHRARSSSSTSTTGRARAMTSIEDIHADFDQKLGVTMRLQRDVTRKSVAMTRKRQLPRLPTPARTKSHWDYLLEEMRWMAIDFSQERNWKRVMQFHLAKDVVVAQNAERVRREKENRQLARDIALQVSNFWRTIERIAARSHVRFEGGVAGSGGPGDDSDSGGANRGPSQESRTTEDFGDGTINQNSSPDGPTLRFKTIDVSSTFEADAVESTKKRIQQIVTASRRARSILQLTAEEAANQNTQRERVLQRLLQDRLTLSNAPTTIFTTFQIVALRWMLELSLSGCNVFLNDQLGMGMASTISAFLRALRYIEEEKPESTKLEVSRPHLIIASAEELHKWCHYVREWNPESGIVQVYGGSSSHRAKQRKEWTKKLTLQQFFSSEEVADLEKEDVTPVFACVCSAEDFDADRDAFESFENWDALIVESEHGGQFDDPEFVKNIAKIQHRGRRVLCCSQPLDAWSSQKTRSAYAELLLREPGVGEWPEEVWSKKIILDKASAGELVRWFGKSGSSLLKTQQEHLAALIVALHCLSLRRVRSEFESELGKLEETSVACALSNSQRTQYRNAAAGFVSASTSSSADRIELWLQFFLKLRSVCNCVDLLGDPEKLGLADLPFLFSSSAKLQNLHELLSRIVVKEHRRVVIYCQLDAMFPVVEMLLALMDLSFVQITGTREMQRRALCHYALRPAVQVALLSTRLGYLEGRQSIPVYGADAIVVLDSDWNSTCDAKMRAAWAKCIVGKAFDVPVYRFHCDETIEAALLRGGSCFSEKVFSEMSPQELVADAAGGEFKVEKPSWWSVNGVYSVSPPAKLNEAMAAAETRERYCGTEIDGSTILRVVNVELDAQEHLLLANSDELTPVEWYAVNYLHSSSSEKKRGDGDLGVEDEWASATSVSMVNSRTTFDQLAALESRRQWQEVEEGSEMFFTADDVVTTAITDAEIQDVLRPLRAKGLDPHYDVMRPPEPPKGPEMIDSEPALSEGVHQQMFRVAYREPAPPAPAPSLILKLKADASVLQSLANDSSGKPLKKKRKDLAGRVIPGGGASGAAGVGASGIKRKHDQQLTNGAGNKPPKEPRLDFDGIPLPSDMTEFADDDFWGDTNLDALDSAAWDDPAVLSGILGGSLDSTSSTGTSIGAGSTSTGTTKKKVKSGGGSAGQATGGTGRARKGSISDSGKDGWNVQDDIVLKKLFELYGSNWTLIAHVFNTATSVSRFVFRKRTPRQCYDRYGKIISSGSLGAGSSSGNATPPVGTPTKDGKATSTSLKQQKLNAAAAAVWTPDVLAERVGIPTNETLLVFSARDSLPGLPPPSILNVPSLAELSLKKKKKKQLPTSDPAASSAASSASSPGGLDDLKSIRTSFDAIMQCMKRKTPPPPIPIPQPSTVITDPAAAVSTAGSMKYSIVTPVPTVVPPPHKSHLDLVELLPRVPLAPDDVIKRSKEAAAVAVQAAAAVASAGRGGTPDVSPLAAAGDSMMGSAAFNASAVAARKAAAQNAASLSAAAAARAGALSTNKLGTTASAWGDPSSAMRPPHASPPTSMHPGMVGQPTALGPTPTATPNGVPVTGAVRAPSAAMPVTTSALLHVLDRMPEIKNKIQAILNRSDCSEAQKVAMIARLLSNTNAINATAVAAAASGNLSAAVSATIAAASGENPSVPAATAQSLDTPIPMPASLANELSSAPTAIPLPASIAATVTPPTITSAAAAAASSAALASALADNDMADLA